MKDHYTRALIVQNRVNQLVAEAAAAHARLDVERLAAIKAEMQVCVDSLYAIREEQLIESLPKPKKQRRRFWQRRTALEVPAGN